LKIEGEKERRTQETDGDVESDGESVRESRAVVLGSLGDSGSDDLSESEEELPVERIGR